MPLHKLKEETFSEGYNFDGSSIRGWKAINESDMTFVPDAGSACLDPFFKEPTLSLICDIQDAVTRQPYSRDPRYIASKAEQYLKQTGIGDTVFFGPEPEFFVFDELSSTRAEPVVLQDRLVRGPLEHRPRRGRRRRQPRPQGRLQARLLPGATDRHPPRPARGDGADPRGAGHLRRGVSTTRWPPPVRTSCR
jgi:glutamine synthetase